MLIDETTWARTAISFISQIKVSRHILYLQKEDNFVFAALGGHKTIPKLDN
jgi:hypothetical protein